MNRSRNFQPFPSPAKASKTVHDGETKENMWSSLLDNVASGKRLPEKTVIVLGGDAETQREFLGTLASDSGKKSHDRHRKPPPIANEFALGYTYHDVLDADQEDTLGRLSIYTLSEPLISYAPLLRPLLSTHTVPDSLLVILLDWCEPWNWVRQIRDWIQLLKEVMTSLDDPTKYAMEEIMQEWQQRKRGIGAYNGGGNSTGNEANVFIPLGPGEWDEALGLPLCVVCHNSDRMDILESERGWREEEFDYVLQFLRTILLKHGASLIYTSNSVPNFLPTLINATLEIQSLIKRQPLKHNVIERDKVLIPPNWDSWGKIRVMREGFDVEAVANGWSVDVKLSRDYVEGPVSSTKEPEDQLSAYEDVIVNPKKSSGPEDVRSSKNGLEIETMSMQEFLAGQLEVMENLKAQEERGIDEKDDKSGSTITYGKVEDKSGDIEERSRVNEHIGPVQFNMGGIQVDAEDMLKRLKDRERGETPDPEAPATPTPEGKSQNEALANFFAGLMKRGGSNSPRPPAA
ncbi:hypothetical protein MMC19_007163 [Ptychographa xylographoides]|nr:hypothetical protein [Ptychographa xylographoides]